MGSHRVVLILFLGFIFVAGESNAAQQQLLFRLHGSNTIGAKLAPALVKAWMEAAAYQNVQALLVDDEETMLVAVDALGHDVAVEIQSHGSSSAFMDLLSNTTDIGMSSRSISASEIKQLANLGNLHSKEAEVVVGLDGVAVIVHPKNPLIHLEIATIRKIFSGEIRSWKDVGGPNTPINVYARDNNSGTFDTFASLVLGKDSKLMQSVKRFESNIDLSDYVSTDQWGIGFVGLPYVKQNTPIAIATAGTEIKPSPLTVATEDYPFSRRLFLYLPPKTNNAYAKSFVEFSASEKGQMIVEQSGFIAQNINSYAQTPAPGAPAEYVQLSTGAKRLSLNIRFDNGQVKLDVKALRDLDRLRTFMALPQNNGSEIMLFGFADANEAIPLYSLGLSLQRVDSVTDALLVSGLKVARARGYGSDQPVADNASETGRYKNRRVEVWIKNKKPTS